MYYGVLLFISIFNVNLQCGVLLGCTLFSLLRANRGNADLSDLRKKVEELSIELKDVKKITSDLSEKIDKLANSLNDLSREVGKLGEVVGFMIEDVARTMLPLWLGRYMGVKVDSLNRAFFEVDGKTVEVDLYGEGFDEKGLSKVIVIGEVKSRIHGVDVKSFHEKALRLLKEFKNPSTYILVLFGLYTHPTAEAEALRRGVIIVTPYNSIQGVAKTSNTL